MKTFKEFITESSNDTVYYVKGELWLAYGQGSGQTIQLPSLKKFLSSDPQDSEHYDSAVDRLVKYSKSLKPLKRKNNVTLYEIPSYPILTGQPGISYDIFGGDVKPIGKIYMIITEEKSTIVNFFEKKNEAMAWIKSIA